MLLQLEPFGVIKRRQDTSVALHNTNSTQTHTTLILARLLSRVNPASRQLSVRRFDRVQPQFGSVILSVQVTRQIRRSAIHQMSCPLLQQREYYSMLTIPSCFTLLSCHKESLAVICTDFPIIADYLLPYFYLSVFCFTCIRHVSSICLLCSITPTAVIATLL